MSLETQLEQPNEFEFPSRTQGGWPRIFWLGESGPRSPARHLLRSLLKRGFEVQSFAQAVAEPAARLETLEVIGQELGAERKLILMGSMENADWLVRAHFSILAALGSRLWGLVLLQPHVEMLYLNNLSRPYLLIEEEPVPGSVEEELAARHTSAVNHHLQRYGDSTRLVRYSAPLWIPPPTSMLQPGAAVEIEHWVSALVKEKSALRPQEPAA